MKITFRYLVILLILTGCTASNALPDPARKVLDDYLQGLHVQDGAFTYSIKTFERGKRPEGAYGQLSHSEEVWCVKIDPVLMSEFGPISRIMLGRNADVWEADAAIDTDTYWQRDAAQLVGCSGQW